MSKKNISKIQLPKNALKRITIGQSFAEYDKVLSKRDVFVNTPALEAALNPEGDKLFFVGRRGTGKTAITLFLESHNKLCVPIHPQIFVPSNLDISASDLSDTRQRPFKSLVTSFSRTLFLEALLEWSKKKSISLDSLPTPLNKDRNLIENNDFDQRQLKLQTQIFKILKDGNEEEWLRQIKSSKKGAKLVNQLGEDNKINATLLIDRIDESWDGSDKSVIFLMGLMHACVQMATICPSVRVLLFLRENIFERVRQIDNEFARLETSVVSLDWTKELLLEMIERRLQQPFNTKPPLGGPTWDAFFENGPSARKMVLDYCQERPRDVLTYCSYAIEAAQSHSHEQVKIEDLQEARRRFSESRLKDLGDEYSENLPMVSLVLQRFYGLGTEFSISGIKAFIKKLVADPIIKQFCSEWFFHYTEPASFIEALYNIGFLGITYKDKEPQFRSLGIKSPTPPPIKDETHVLIHPCFHDALALSQKLIVTLGDDITLREEGIVSELPEGTTFEDYQISLEKLIEEIKTLKSGTSGAKQWEDIIGEVLRLCFCGSLNNIQALSRDVDGRVIRDWMTSNVAHSNFWEIVRQRYNATQVIWECKNYQELKSDDFHQAQYYMTQAAGRFVVIAFRGNEIKKSYYQHIRRCCTEKDGMVLILREKDIQVFLRQAKNGKIKDSHIRDIYDRTVRAIS